MEKNIDCMKYRKSTHLAGIDVETIASEKGNCILTIKDAFYDKNVDVSGNKTDGYFLIFIDHIKPMLVNSINRKTIANIIKVNKGISPLESRNIGNWIGLKIELYFDPNVKMMGQTVGGIRVMPKSPIPDISDINGLSILKESKTLNDLKINWSKLTHEEQSLPTILALKNKMKGDLPND